MGSANGSNAIYNRNWLSYHLMKAALLIWRIFFRGNNVEIREALKHNTREMNTKKNGYEAEAHFLRLIIQIEFLIGWALIMGTLAISILSILLPEEFYLPAGSMGFVLSIPLSLMIIHGWKGLNLEIIKARKIPYREKSGYFTEVRNKDLLFPIITFILVTCIAIIVTS